MYFVKKNRSYQLFNVSILKFRMLTFVMLKKVYKNENSNLVFGNIFSAENDCRKAVWRGNCFSWTKLVNELRSVENFV
jgi:hypothetical protein